MKYTRVLLLFIGLGQAFGCVHHTSNAKEQKIAQELKQMNELLKSPDFCLLLAKSQDTAYYKGIGEAVPPFLSAAEDSAHLPKSITEQNLALRLAGFYALECGMNYWCQQASATPAAWLQQFAAGKTDSTVALLLSRFANACWKTGQPFLSMEKIQQPDFTVVAFLPAQEAARETEQVKRAAQKLLSSLQDVKDSSTAVQMNKIRSLLHSQAYAKEMAASISAAATDDQKDSTVLLPARQQKIATNLPGLYALECCTDYLATTRQQLPSEILLSITSNSINAADKDLFSRFANATWKTSQPFRGLQRIERATFTPFYFLNEADIDKDWVQIKAAALTLLNHLNAN